MHTEEKINILLVDDRPTNLALLETVLDAPQYRLVKASSGEEALRHLLNADFAVILLDVMMPELNGFETATLIKQRRQSMHIPIIFITGLEVETLAKDWVGPVDYISKPFDTEILKSKVSAFIDLYKRNRQLKQKQKGRNGAEAA